MSYDVTVMGEWFNYTSNMGKFFRDFDVYPPDWNGLHRGAAGERITKALQVIRSENLSDLRNAYDAPNGWGTVDSAVNWLERIANQCLAPLPDETVQVSW